MTYILIGVNNMYLCLKNIRKYIRMTMPLLSAILYINKNAAPIYAWWGLEVYYQPSISLFCHSIRDAKTL